jgi:hypothetical protein
VRTARPGPLLAASFFGNLPREWWSDAARQLAARRGAQRGPPVTWAALVLDSPAMRQLFPLRRVPGAAWPPPQPPPSPSPCGRRRPAGPPQRRAGARRGGSSGGGGAAATAPRPKPWGGGGAAACPFAPAPAEPDSSSSGGGGGDAARGGPEPHLRALLSRGGWGSPLDALWPPLPPDDLAPLFPPKWPAQLRWCPAGGNSGGGTSVSETLSGAGSGVERGGSSGSSSRSSRSRRSSDGSVGRRSSSGSGAAAAGRAAVASREARLRGAEPPPDSDADAAAAAAAAAGPPFAAGAWGAAVWCDLPAGHVPAPYAGALLRAAAGVRGRGAAGGPRASAEGAWSSGEEEEEDEEEDEEGGGTFLEDDLSGEEYEEEGLEDEEEEEGEEGGSEAEDGRLAAAARAAPYMTPQGVVFGYWGRTPLG